MRDPILFAGGQSNLYAYVNNEPVNHVDLTGLRDLDQLRSQVRAAYEQWWSTRTPAFQNWGPVSNSINFFGVEEAPVCVDYATDAANGINQILNDPNTRAFPVWGWQSPTNTLGEFETNAPANVFNSHNTTQVYTMDDGKVTLLEEFDPWWRIP